MAIDPRIAMGFQMPEAPSQLGMAANALQLKNMLRQGQMQDMEFQRANAEAERQGQLRNYLSQNDVSTPEGMAKFRSQFPLEAPKIEASMLEPQIKRAGLAKDEAQAKKYGADAQAAEFKLRMDRIGQNLQLLSTVQTPEQAAQWVSNGVTQGLISMEQAQQEIGQIPKDQQGLAQWLQRQQAAGMTVAQQMEQQWKAKEFGLNQEKFAETKRSNRVTEGISQGNLSLRKQENERARTDGGKPPAGYRWTKSGTLEFIPGGPADPSTKQNTGNITEGERNSGGYASRMTEATKLLDQFESAGRETYTTRIAGAVPGFGSAARGEVMSPEQQQYRQAAEDWVRAKLRKESGAVIGKDEMEAEIQTYFPMPWDTPENVAQKRRAREVANEAMRTAAGRGFTQKPAATPPAGGPYSDAEKERRYQEWKARQGK